MQHVAEGEYKGAFHPGQFLEGQVALVQLAVFKTADNNVIDQIFNMAGGGFFHGPGGCLHGIGQ
ncbi:MAG: hypothetical protein A2269_00395 [Lentisphaerae bacterium RIFOXYA12_FULL_60_10]|nr:MAG: hypothetical protein A2269_00395 [Lentisphaerae bacterium RIFOXYA12_FULL_60_10]